MLLSEVYQGIFVQIFLGKIHQINEIYSYDEKYAHTSIDFDDISYYFIYMPDFTLEILMAFSI